MRTRIGAVIDAAILDTPSWQSAQAFVARLIALLGLFEVVVFDGAEMSVAACAKFAGILGVLLIVPIFKSLAADDVGDRGDELRFVLARRRDAR